MSETEFSERIKQNPLPVVVDFWAPWCGPCRAIEPVMKKLGADYDGRVDVWKVNADEQPDVLSALSIYGIPTLIAFKDGQEIARHTGAASAAALSTLFEAAISGDKPANTGPALLDRALRLGAAIVLFLLGYQNNFHGMYLIPAVLSVVVAFTAIYDRCPIYKAVSARFNAWLGKDQAD